MKAFFHALTHAGNELLGGLFVTFFLGLAIVSEVRSRRRREATESIGRSLYMRRRRGESSADFATRVRIAAELIKNVRRQP